MGTTTPSISLAAEVDTIPGIDEATRVVLRRLRGQGFDGTNLSLHRQQLAAVQRYREVELTKRIGSQRFYGVLEAYEEVGLPFPSSLIIDSDNDIPHIPNIHILCTLSPHISQWGIIVVPVVAYLSGPVSSSASSPPLHTYILTPTLTLQANPTEVDRIFTHPLESILDPSSSVSIRDLAEKGSEDWPYDEELYNYTDRVYPQLGPNHNNNTDTTDNIPSSIYRMHRFRSVASPIKGLTAEILLRTAYIAYARPPTAPIEQYAPGQVRGFKDA
ncbi:nudix hydrolase 15 [Lentinula edodes]|uniref:Nudix hydrolase 15 n=1 Tax=Lentinula edodes TaxID=5353 RepID=A0A1Q3EE66_LENED|nr:nudix hydrolase 15 [Lentinula edodes]